MATTTTSYTPREVTSVMGVVDTFLRWKNVQKSNRSYKYHHPSEFGKCLRKAQYLRYEERDLLTVEKEPLASQKLRLFDKGHNMHARWQRYFEDIGVLRGVWECANPHCDYTVGKQDQHGVFRPKVCEKCDSEEFDYHESQVFDEELQFRGNCDLLLDFSHFKEQKLFNGVRKAFNVDHLPKGVIVADMKTINMDQFKRKLAKDGPHSEYIIQLTIYIHILDCEYGLLIYENKNNSEILAFKVDRNEKVFDAIKTQSTSMNEMTKDHLLPPPRPLTKSDYECKYCDFAPLCHKSKVWNDPDLEDKRKKFYKGLL